MKSSKHKSASSVLPHEFNDNWGFNWGMDGFQYDMDYGHGVEESIDSDPIPQPSTSGMSLLPDDVIVGGYDPGYAHPDEVEQETEGAMDLEALGVVATLHPSSDRSHTKVVDHGWLEDVEQDIYRLPSQPTDDIMLDLQEAWGDRSNGLHRLNMYERPDDEDKIIEVVDQKKLASFVRLAMRLSAAGKSMREIRTTLETHLTPNEMGLLRHPLKAVAAEHGLVGNVYVRASAYPRLHRGKWSKAFQQAAKRSSYIIACPGEDCSECACSTGLKVVNHPDEINWNREYERNAPQLEERGQLDRLATVVDKRDALRRAFLKPTSKKSFDFGLRPSHTTPVERISKKEAFEEFSKSSPQEIQTIGPNDGKAKAESKFARRLGALVKANLLTEKEANRLMGSTAPIPVREKIAAMLVSRTKSATYHGTLTDARVGITQQEFDRISGEKQEKQAKIASIAEDVSRTKLLDSFFTIEKARQDALRKVGVLQKQLQKPMSKESIKTLVANTFSTQERNLVSSELDSVLMKSGFFEENPTTVYKGPVLREARSSVESKLLPREVQAALHWVNQQINEGFVGKDLDALITARVSKPIQKAAKSQLVQLRRAKEGVAGHLYVEASAYASSKGTSGCEKGALQHRTNGIKYVLTMDRCDGCVFRNADDVCQKYNKTLLSHVPDDVADQVRAASFRSHAMSDAESTASLFASNPVVEYQLHNANMDNVETEEFSGGTLDGIFFGGGFDL